MKSSIHLRIDRLHTPLPWWHHRSTISLRLSSEGISRKVGTCHGPTMRFTGGGPVQIPCPRHSACSIPSSGMVRSIRVDKSGNHQTRQDNDHPGVVRDDYTTTGGRKINVIDGRHRILAAIRSTHCKWNKRGYRQVPPNITSHIAQSISQFFPRNKT